MYLIIGILIIIIIIIIITVINTVVNVFCIIRGLAVKFNTWLKKKPTVNLSYLWQMAKICLVMTGPLSVISQSDKVRCTDDITLIHGPLSHF